MNLVFPLFVIAWSCGLVQLVIILKLRAMHLKRVAVGSQYGELHSSHGKPGNPSGNSLHNRCLRQNYKPAKHLLAIKILFPLRNKLANYAIFMYQKMDDCKKTLFTYCNLFTYYSQIKKTDKNPEDIGANHMFVFICWTLFFVNLLITYYFNNEKQVKTPPQMSKFLSYLLCK